MLHCCASSLQIKVSVSSGGDCLRSYRPDIRKGRYNTITLHVKTTVPDNLLFYLGSAKYVSGPVHRLFLSLQLELTYFLSTFLWKTIKNAWSPSPGIQAGEGNSFNPLSYVKLLLHRGRYAVFHVSIGPFFAICLICHAVVLLDVIVMQCPNKPPTCASTAVTVVWTSSKIEVQEGFLLLVISTILMLSLALRRSVGRYWVLDGMFFSHI